jgi:hypothetical protein
MKYSHLLILLLVLSNLTFGQGLALLDSHNGFKNFKLESSFDNYKSVLKYTSEEKGIKSYDHISPSSITFQKSNPKVASFDFYNSQLYDIMLFFEDYEGMSYKRIIGELKILFGEPTEVKKTLTGNIWVAWEGQKVKLYTQYFVDSENFCIEFKSINIERKLLSKDF